MSPKHILWFREIASDDVATVGGKGANLGEMYRLRIPVPNGFVVTVSAYYQFLETTRLQPQIHQILKTTNVDQPEELLVASKKIKQLIKKSPIPSTIALDIMRAYKKLSDFGGLKNIPVAVRSSATAEDSADASFAGQQETFLNVVGESNVVQRVRDCWASLFTPRSIFYRAKKHLNHFRIGVAVPVQKLVNSRISGIVFTQNPVTGNKSEIIVETIWGLGEYIVQGKVTPDHYLIDKNNWTILSQSHQPQTVQLVRSEFETKEVGVPKSKQNLPKITNRMALEIAKTAQKIHNHYGKAQDIEFAIGKNQLYIVQTRPITVSPHFSPENKGKTITQTPILRGDAASPGIAAGVVIIIKNPDQINRAQKGQILVTTMTSPDFVPAMKRVSGIVTDMGGQTSHAAIVSRELGVPCVVGAKTATKILKEGQIITINGATGEIWSGDLNSVNPILPSPKLSHSVHLKTATKIYVNLGEPELAVDISKRNVDGIGLLRAEFMIANIGIHPKKMIADGRQHQFVDQLADGLIKFCRSFNPRPVIYRATDFKTNEYRFLKWGKLYEPQESNPMLGFRGAIRYIHSADVFSLELEAIKKVRGKHDLKNLWLMIPFVHTPHELLQVKKIVSDHGILRSPTFKLFMMVEIPSNVILLDKFIDIGIDGISIGSNDLTMLTLGIDRDNSEVAPAFNELDPSILWSLRRAITKAKKRGILASICGQAPSNHPDLVEKLVRWGISSISVSPDAIDRTREIVAWAEKKKLK